MATSIKDVMYRIAEIRKAKAAGADPDKVRGIVVDAIRKSAAVRKGEFAVGGDMPDSDQAVIKYIRKSAKVGDEEAKEFQDWNDASYLWRSILKARGEGHAFRGSRLYRNGLNRFKKITKALDTSTANRGTDFIPTEFSGQLIDLVRLQRKVPSVFPMMEMSSNPFKLPVVNTDLTAVKISESTSDDATAMTAGQPGSTNVTLTAQKYGVRVPFSEDIVEDSIIAILPWVRQQAANAMVTAEEDAIINGDTAASHQDNDVTSSTDARKLWNGLRKVAPSGSKVDASNANPTHALLTQVRAAMQKYGVDPSKLVLLCGSDGYAKLTDLDEVNTVDKYGDKATILTGELAKWSGIPVLVSEKVREDLNASGVRDSTTQDRGVIILAHLPSFMIGLWRKVTIKTWEKVETDQTILTVLARKAFVEVYASTERAVGILYNVNTG